MLKIDKITKSFNERVILRELSMELEPGKYGLLGPNGAGKTTLLRCIAGVYDIESGSVTLDDKYSVGQREYMSQVGYLPQSFGLFKEMKVSDILLYFASMKESNEKRARENVQEVLEQVNLADRAKDKVKRLSGGMIRRLGIAQALLGDPRIIIFDEPTAGLDPEERVRFKKIVENLSKEKIVIISTHIVSDVQNICNRVLVLNHGSILFDGNIQELEAKAKENGIESSGYELLEEGYLCVLKE